jgi:hypothetical protein
VSRVDAQFGGGSATERRRAGPIAGRGALDLALGRLGGQLPPGSWPRSTCAQPSPEHTLIFRSELFEPAAIHERRDERLHRRQVPFTCLFHLH